MIEYYSFLVSAMGILMSLSHFPQAHRIYQRKSAKNLSLLMYSTFTLGSFVWLGYGILLGELPIIISFSLGSIGTTLVLALALKYR